MQVTVYQGPATIRVVAGTHAAHEGARASRVAVYPSAKLAYAAEADPAVRANILRLDPHAAPEPGDGPLGPIAPVTIPAGALARPAPSRVRKPFKSMPAQRLSEAREPTDDPLGLRPGQCVHPAGCDNQATDGDIYCLDCREAVETENFHPHGGE